MSNDRLGGQVVPEVTAEEHAKIGSAEIGAKKVIVLDENGNQVVNFGARFGTNNIDEASSTLTYVGKEDKDGNWVIQKIDTSSGTSITYATQTNNPTYTTYSDAWTARTSLTYSAYKDAF